MVVYNNSITILGSCGGVAKAVLAILNKTVQDKSDPINPIIEKSLIHLVDKREIDQKSLAHLYPNIKNQLVIHQFDLINQVALMEHLKKTNTTVVIDVSWADTVEVMKCCNNMGINYVNTALENPFIDGFFYLHSG